MPPGALDAEPDAELHVVELRMPSGLWYTLRLPGWDEVEGESAPMLAHDGELYVFRSARDLLDWCAEATEHELATSSAVGAPRAAARRGTRR